MGSPPAWGEVECELGGTGGTICGISNGPNRLWLGIEVPFAVALRLARRLGVETAAFMTYALRGFGMNGLSVSGGGVGR